MADLIIQGMEIPDKHTIELMHIELACISRECDRHCENCNLMQDRDELIMAFQEAIRVLEIVANAVPLPEPPKEGGDGMIISELHLEEEPKPHKCLCGATPRITYNGLLWVVECPKCFDFESGWSALDTITTWNKRVDKRKETGKMTPSQWPDPEGGNTNDNP